MQQCLVSIVFDRAESRSTAARVTPGVGQFAVIQSVAPSLGMEVSPVNLREAAEIERAVTAFARFGNGGLVVTSGPLSLVHRYLIITLAARHKLPAVYAQRFYVAGGGLVSYGARSARPVPARGRLCRPYSQGREARRPAGAGTDQVRVGDKSQNREGAWPRCAAIAARPGRPSDRIGGGMSPV